MSSKLSAINKVLLFQLDMTSKQVRRFSQKEFDRLKMGISVDQWVLLKIISESERLSQSELSELTHRDPASITRTLDILVKKNLASREAIEGNRRQYDIILTEEGSMLVKKYLPIIEQQRAKSTEGFSSEEVNQFIDFLERMRSNMT